jgi:hypothetical protein
MHAQREERSVLEGLEWPLVGVRNQGESRMLEHILHFRVCARKSLGARFVPGNHTIPDVVHMTGGIAERCRIPSAHFESSLSGGVLRRKSLASRFQ